MATYLPGSGALSINDINTLFARGNNLNAYRGTTYYTSSSGPFSFPSGAISISNFYGTGPQANRGTASTTLTGGANVSLNVTTLPGYVSGNTTITITISGICYGSGGTPGLTLTGGSGTDTISIVNNSYITGSAGAGVTSGNGGNGGPALSLGWPVTITNNGYIGGGGGAGAGGSGLAGGNGAGGNSSSGTGANGSGVGGSPYSSSNASGGGGGWGAGGGRGAYANNGSGTGTGGAGGGPGVTGGNGTVSPTYGGGTYPTLAGSGGKAINLNGSTVAWGAPGQVRVYGGIS